MQALTADQDAATEAAMGWRPAVDIHSELGELRTAHQLPIGAVNVTPFNAAAIP